MAHPTGIRLPSWNDLEYSLSFGLPRFDPNEILVEKRASVAIWEMLIARVVWEVVGVIQFVVVFVPLP